MSEDLVRFASTMSGLDIRLFASEISDTVAIIQHPSPRQLAKYDNIDAAASFDSPEIRVDEAGRRWAIASGKAGLLAAGPFLDEDTSEADLTRRFNTLGISFRSVSEYYRSLSSRNDNGSSALLSFLQICADGIPNRYLAAGKFSAELSPIPIHDPSLDDAVRMEREVIEAAYRDEAIFMDAVSRGDRKALEKIIRPLLHVEDRIVPDHMRRRLPENPLRLQKNFGIILNTTLRLAARRGGLSPLSLHGISDGFATRIEKTGSTESMTILILEMFTTYVESVRRLGVKGHSRPVRRAMQYINDNLDSGFTLANLAAEAGMHPASLSRLFRQETGITLNTHIRRRRVEEARWLLENGESSITDVSVLVGYGDPAAFSRAFKRETGLSPREYRSRSIPSVVSRQFDHTGG